MSANALFRESTVLSIGFNNATLCTRSYDEEDYIELTLKTAPGSGDRFFATRAEASMHLHHIPDLEPPNAEGRLYAHGEQHVDTADEESGFPSPYSHTFTETTMWRYLVSPRGLSYDHVALHNKAVRHISDRWRTSDPDVSLCSIFDDVCNSDCRLDHLAVFWMLVVQGPITRSYHRRPTSEDMLSGLRAFSLARLDVLGEDWPHETYDIISTTFWMSHILAILIESIFGDPAVNINPFLYTRIIEETEPRVRFDWIPHSYSVAPYPHYEANPIIAEGVHYYHNVVVSFCNTIHSILVEEPIRCEKLVDVHSPLLFLPACMTAHLVIARVAEHEPTVRAELPGKDASPDPDLFLENAIVDAVIAAVLASVGEEEKEAFVGEEESGQKNIPAAKRARVNPAPLCFLVV